MKQHFPFYFLMANFKITQKTVTDSCVDYYTIYSNWVKNNTAIDNIITYPPFSHSFQQFLLKFRFSLLTQFMVVCLSGVWFTFVVCNLPDLRW